jgi:multisubunit Na+/H+ antiporter MnhC subunit
MTAMHKHNLKRVISMSLICACIHIVCSSVALKASAHNSLQLSLQLLHVVVLSLLLLLATATTAASRHAMMSLCQYASTATPLKEALVCTCLVYYVQVKTMTLYY